MTTAQWLLVFVVCIPLVLVLMNRLRIDLAALVMAVALGILQFVGFGMLGSAGNTDAVSNVLSGFGQPIVLILISLFILTHMLEKSGVTRWIAWQLLKVGGVNQSRLIGLFATTAAFLSLFMNNLAAGALVLPIAMEVARRTAIKPSKLLIPVAYGTLLGGSATYFTSANIIVSTLLQNASPPQSALGVLDFTPTGGLIAIAGILFLTFLGPRLLPDRKPTEEQGFARMTGSELEEFFSLAERVWEGRVLPSADLVGKTLAQSEIGRQWGVTVAAIYRAHDDILLPQPQQVIRENDVLVLVGREEKIKDLAELGLDVHPESSESHLTSRGVTFAEIILSPHSKALGQTLKDLDFRRHYGLSVVAVHRLERSYRTDVGNLNLEVGDALLVVGTTAQLERLRRSGDFIVLKPNWSDLPVNKKEAAISVVIVLAGIVAAIAGVPVYLAMLAAAVLALLLKMLTVEEAYRSVEWQVVFLIAGMYVVSEAMVETRLADLLGSALLPAIRPFGGLGLAAGAYLLTAVLTQFMGGQVTALVTGPITISAAIQMGVSPQAIAVATAIGCSASFFTPLAHPVNILMIAPGNYTFGDFFRSGWILTIISFVMLLVGMVLFWRL
ncbi:MAG: SLC13 family permease [Anaerolineae bacterium CG03_land_8_20_14_0_80_58_20]|nr:MAG: SLC13 family permease [Anaerolineae bacterium CG03_land_8_20_14_0_80_58_20]